MLRFPPNKQSIIQTKERAEKHYLKTLHVLGHSKSRKQIGRMRVVEPRLLRRVNRQSIPVYNITIPNARNDFLD